MQTSVALENPFSELLLWLRHPSEANRIPANVERAVLYLPISLSLFLLLCFLVQRPQTYTFRLALSLITTPLFFLLAFALKWAPKGNLLINIVTTMSGLILAIRTLELGISERPMRRLPPGSHSSSKKNNISPVIRHIVDSIDLSMNLRGVGYDYGEGSGLKLPRGIIQVQNNKQYLLYKILFSIPLNYILSDVIGTYCATDPTIRTLATGEHNLRDLNVAKQASTFAAIMFGVPAFLSLVYDLTATFVIALMPGQNYEQWPPLFGAPWFADSLHEFWASRWHQVLRRTFLLTGGYPLGFLFGRYGLVVGTFASSGLLHAIMLLADGASAFPWSTFAFFVTQAPGVLLEEWFRALTGRRVGGLWGRVWVYSWFWLIGREVCNSWIQAGIFDVPLVPACVSISRFYSK